MMLMAAPKSCSGGTGGSDAASASIFRHTFGTQGKASVHFTGATISDGYQCYWWVLQVYCVLTKILRDPEFSVG